MLYYIIISILYYLLYYILDLYGSSPPRTYQNSNFDGLFNQSCFLPTYQKVQRSMHIAAFLETEKNVVQGNCCLQVAICHEEKMFFETNNNIATKITCLETCNF